jgi:hypothetical protein
VLSKGSTTRRGVAAGLAALLMSAGLVAVAQAPAAAASVRPGAGFGQVDLVLDGYETQRVADGGYFDSRWAATVICWTSGTLGQLLSYGVCQKVVRTCALQASADHRTAGITVEFWPHPGWSCWEY